MKKLIKYIEKLADVIVIESESYRKISEAGPKAFIVTGVILFALAVFCIIYNCCHSHYDENIKILILGFIMFFYYLLSGIKAKNNKRKRK